MAIIYKATLTPSKIDLIGSWLLAQPWGGACVEQVGAFRLDDPAGDVGIETHLLSMRDGGVLQVPVTYRGAPFPEGDLIGTMEHSVLGKRWVYEGCSDPVYVAAAVTVVLTGGTEAVLVTETGRDFGPATTRVRGSGVSRQAVPQLAGLEKSAGDPTRVQAGEFELQVHRRVAPQTKVGQVLTGTWPGQPEGRVLLRVLPLVSCVVN